MTSARGAPRSRCSTPATSRPARSAGSGCRCACRSASTRPGCRASGCREGRLNPDVRLSVVLGLWQDRDPLEALETAEIADALGYPMLWIGEMATFDAFALATAIAARTERIALTVGPLAVGVRDPMALAMGVASVAALGRRPVHLAIGASSPVVVERWHGRPWRRTATHIRETAEALRPLLAGERAEFEGELVRTHGYRLRLPAPGVVDHDRGLRRPRRAGGGALRRPDGDQPLHPGARGPAARAARPLRRGGRRRGTAAGRLDPGLRRPNRGGDRPAQPRSGRLLAAPGYGEMFAAAGFGELVERARGGMPPARAARRVPPELAAAIGLVGSEAEVRARAARVPRRGRGRVAIVPATAGDPGGRRTLEALAGWCYS